MPQTDPQAVIQGLIQADLFHTEQDNRPRPSRPTVTVSRDFGSGGHIIAQRVAERLGVPLWDRGILDSIAQYAQVAPELMDQLDEKVQQRHDAWLYNLLSGQNAFLTSYRRHLVNVVLALAESGAVILGRGAHLILATRPVLKVRVVGSPYQCATRVATREGIDPETALEKVAAVNREREHYLWNLFRHHIDEATTFDLVINSDKFGDRWDDIASLIIDVLARTGLASHHPGAAP